MDELLAQIFGDAVLGRLPASRRTQLLFRLFFGVLGGVLGAVGAVYIAQKPGLTSNGALRFSMVALLASVGCFWLFNVALARRWWWPAAMTAGSLAMVFVTRILFGK